MSTYPSRIPEDRRIYLLADHLDAVLAAGEDLKCLYHDRFETALFEKRSQSLGLEAFVAKARKVEFAAMGRIKLASAYAESVAQRDDRIAILARLFVAGTRIVIDSIDDLCDSERHAFCNGFDPFVYLRGRGLIAEDCSCLNIIERIEIDDSFLLAERIELGALLDMCSRFLDLLDKHFDLFQDAPLTDHPALPAPHLPAIEHHTAIKVPNRKSFWGFATSDLRA